MSITAAGPPNYLTNNHTKSSQSQLRDEMRGLIPLVGRSFHTCRKFYLITSSELFSSSSYFTIHVFSVDSEFSLLGTCAHDALRRVLMLILVSTSLQSRSGKSSLIKTVFKVDMTVRSILVFFDLLTVMDPRRHQRTPISTPGFVQMITVT